MMERDNSHYRANKKISVWFIGRSIQILRFTFRKVQGNTTPSQRE